VCWFCTHGVPTACAASNPDHYGPEGGTMKEKGGGLFGYTDLYGGFAGGQAERVRVPYADYGLRVVPPNLRDEQVLFLTDILPTGWTAIDWVMPVQDQTVAVFGCGPVGLMAMKIARLRGAARVIGVDVQPYRLEMAQRAAGAEPVNAAEHDPVQVLRHMTQGRGPDICVDAVGMEPDRSWLEKISAVFHLQRGSMKVLEMALSAVRRGGKVSVVGVYGTTYDNFPLGQIFDKGIKLFAGQALVHNYIDELLGLIEERKLRADDIITHVLPLQEAPRGYEIFNRKEDNCVKVVLKP
jgi:threonine dehydrogenase-like Zn-dependent dehydrogenase